MLARIFALRPSWKEYLLKKLLYGITTMPFCHLHLGHSKGLKASLCHKDGVITLRINATKTNKKTLVLEQQMLAEFVWNTIGDASATATPHNMGVLQLCPAGTNQELAGFRSGYLFFFKMRVLIVTVAKHCLKIHDVEYSNAKDCSFAHVCGVFEGDLGRGICNDCIWIEHTAFKKRGEDSIYEMDSSDVSRRMISRRDDGGDYDNDIIYEMDSSDVSRMLEWLAGRLLRSKDDVCRFVYECLEGGCRREADVDDGFLNVDGTVQCICSNVVGARSTPRLYAAVKDDVGNKTKKVIAVSNSNDPLCGAECSLIGTFKVWRSERICIEYEPPASYYSCAKCNKMVK
jgi:hypothetical protein